MDDAVWNHAVISKYRERLSTSECLWLASAIHS